MLPFILLPFVAGALSGFVVGYEVGRSEVREPRQGPERVPKPSEEKRKPLPDQLKAPPDGTAALTLVLLAKDIPEGISRDAKPDAGTVVDLISKAEHFRCLTQRQLNEIDGALVPRAAEPTHGQDHVLCSLDVTPGADLIGTKSKFTLRSQLRERERQYRVTTFGVLPDVSVLKEQGFSM